MFLFPCWHWPFRWCSGPRQPMHQAALAATWPRCRSGVSVHWTRPATSGRQDRSWARRGSLTFDRTGREGEPRIFPVRSTFRRECADRCGDGDRRAVRSTAARQLRCAERDTGPDAVRALPRGTGLGGLPPPNCDNHARLVISVCLWSVRNKPPGRGAARAARPPSPRRGATSGSARRASDGGRHRSSAPGAAGRRRWGVAAPCPGSARRAAATRPASAPGACRARAAAALCRRGVAAPCPSSAPAASASGRSTATARSDGGCRTGASMADQAVWMTVSGGRFIPPAALCEGRVLVATCCDLRTAVCDRCLQEDQRSGRWPRCWAHGGELQVATATLDDQDGPCRSCGAAVTDVR